MNRRTRSDHRRNSSCENDITDDESINELSETSDYDIPQTQAEVGILQKIVERKWCILIGVAIVVAAVGIPSFFDSIREQREKEAEEALINVIRDMKKMFPSQDDELWKAAYSSINIVRQGIPTQHPTVLLLLDRGESEMSNCIIMKLAKGAQLSIKSTNSIEEPIILNASELNGIDKQFQDKFIEDYRQKVEDQGVMVVKQLHKLPTVIAEKLHSFCDQHEPLVPKAMYLFTMSVSSNQQKPTKAAEEMFKEVWGKNIKEEYLNPLVARLTDLVYFVKAEKFHSCD